LLPKLLDYWDLNSTNNLQSGDRIWQEVVRRVKPPQRLSVVEACQKYMRVSTPGGYEGPWSAEIAPYMKAPMNAMTSRLHEAVVFVGVAQSGKTAALAEGLISYSIAVDPSDCTLVMPSQNSARDFSKRRLDRLLRNSPALNSQLAGGETDNLLDKQMKSGALITLGWPTVSQLASKNLKRIVLSDLDRMPQDVGGEGDPFALGKKRTQSFMSAGMIVAESTPGFDVVDQEWEAPDEWSHEAPPVSGGILGLYNQGTRERFYWSCPHCDELFRAEMTYFRWYEEESSVKSAATAHMVCPHCGGLIEETQKTQLNLTGQWLAEGWREGNIRQAKYRSFWMQGVAAAFQRWSSLAYNMIIAREEFEETGSPDRLRTVTNVDWGLPFSPIGLGKERSPSSFASLATTFDLQIVPDKARFLVATVDLQKNRFVVQIVAHGPKRERWVIDRFNITKSNRVDGSGEKARVSPFEFAEDFDVLLDLLADKKYKYADGQELTIRILATDTGGTDDATANAYAFWRKAARVGVADRVMLIKGNGSSKAKRLMRSSAQKIDTVPLWIVGTNQLKSEFFFDLSRPEPGPGKLHISSQLEAFFFEELSSEYQDPISNKWLKKSYKARNESIDLLVYDLAALTAIGGEGLDWDKEESLPDWARQHQPREVVVVDKVARAQKEVKAGVDWAAMAKDLNG
jgi:phage terminase large subunit GpA-like protein